MGHALVSTWAVHGLRPQKPYMSRPWTSLRRPRWTHRPCMWAGVSRCLRQTARNVRRHPSKKLGAGASGTITCGDARGKWRDVFADGTCAKIERDASRVLNIATLLPLRPGPQGSRSLPIALIVSVARVLPVCKEYRSAATKLGTPSLFRRTPSGRYPLPPEEFIAAQRQAPATPSQNWATSTRNGKFSQPAPLLATKSTPLGAGRRG